MIPREIISEYLNNACKPRFNWLTRKFQEALCRHVVYLGHFFTKKQSELTFETSAIAATTAYATRAATRIDELAADNTADIDNDTAAETNDHADLSLYAVLLSKANLFSETEEMHKLLMSGCVNLMNHDQRSVYKNILSSSQYNDIIQKCSAMECLDTNDAVGLIDNMKVDFKDKKSTSGVLVRGDEGASQSTKIMAIVNEYDTTFGRRSDLLVIGNDNDELANIEFKKAISLANNALISSSSKEKSTLSKRRHLFVILQQSKNIRINCCIMNYINLMTDSTSNIILYYDFIGRLGYLVQLFQYDGAYICQKLDCITIPGSMLVYDYSAYIS
ncbi:hypothetical protein EDC94DRAFT_647461 [Helicostylum pulchrum]|nr:hypothetical protein EDC94DRAFT_647461 [Helicostylum pulchrum]